MLLVERVLCLVIIFGQMLKLSFCDGLFGPGFFTGARLINDFSRLTSSVLPFNNIYAVCPFERSLCYFLRLIEKRTAAPRS